MIGFDFSFFVQNDNLKVKFKVLKISVMFENFNNLVWLEEVHINHLEKTHPCFRSFFQNP